MKHQVQSWIREDGKRDIITAVWGKQVPTELRYFFGGKCLHEDDLVRILEAVVSEERLMEAGQIEIQIGTGRDMDLPGKPVVIQIVNPNKVNFALELLCGKRYCPLYMVGSHGMPGYINFFDPESSEDAPPLLQRRAV